MRKKLIKPPIKRAPQKKPKAETTAEENPRAPLCRICNHRHFGVDHIWK